MTLVELVSRALHLRESILEQCIRTMLVDPEGTGLSKEVYCHPLLQSMRPFGSRPAYIPAQLFALSLVDQVNLSNSGEFTQGVAEIMNIELRRSLRSLFNGVPRGFEIEAVQRWFLQVMDQASGIYRVRSLAILTCIATMLIVPLNFDAIRLSEHAVHSSLTQKIFDAELPELVRSNKVPVDIERLTASADIERYTAKELVFPIGWASEEGHPSGWWILRKVTGLLTSLLAIMIGAPLLFDTLNRYTIVRLVVKPYDSFPDVQELGSSSSTA